MDGNNTSFTLWKWISYINGDNSIDMNWMNVYNVILENTTNTITMSNIVVNVDNNREMVKLILEKVCLFCFLL